MKVTILLGLCLLLLAGCGALVAKRLDRLGQDAVTQYPPEGQIVDVEGVPVHAVVSGSGPDLVIIHGANGNTRDWTFAFAERMSRDFRVIVFDRPGFGFTGRVDPDYARAFSRQSETLAEQARLLSKAAASLGAERPIVLGHSYGGAVALAWALEEPLSALVPVAAVSNVWEGNVWYLYNIAASRLGGAGFVPMLSAYISPGYVDRLMDGFFAPNAVPDGYADHVGAPLSLRPETVRTNARQIVALKPQIAAMVPRYPDIDVPVEIVHGTADTDVPLSIHSEKLVAQIPGAHIDRVKDQGHMVHHSAPEAVADAIYRAASRAGLR